MTTTVTFEVGTDVDLAANNVANRVRLAEPRLPEEVRRNGVTVQKQNQQLHPDRHPDLARRPPGRRLPLELRDAQHRSSR